MTFLKLEDITVMEFDIKEKYYKVHRPDLLPFSLRNCLSDTTSITDKEKLLEAGFENKELLAAFFLNRSISIKREHAKLLMNQLGIKQNNDFDSRYKIMLLCKALSVSDCYWITDKEEETWNNVNLWNNPLHETIQQISLYGKSLTITGKLRSPELTGQGAYAKAWFRENGKLFLFKGNSNGGNESEREVLASNILDCFNVPHVKYTLEKKDNLTVCKCENMNFDNTSLVDSIEYDIWTSKQGKNFIEEARKADPEMYYKTIVVDYLISNSDRHGGNWGFYMNNQTGKLIRMHPLFDHNNAFDTEFMKNPDGGICQLIPGKTQKQAALYAIKHCDFRCIKPVTKDMFINEIMYESFMSRACELGLYKKEKVNLFQKYVTKKEKYVPVKIENDNTFEYWNSIKQNSTRNISHIKNNEKNKINIIIDKTSNKPLQADTLDTIADKISDLINKEKNIKLPEKQKKNFNNKKNNHDAQDMI